jgi:hypothetical protein
MGVARHSMEAGDRLTDLRRFATQHPGGPGSSQESLRGIDPIYGAPEDDLAGRMAETEHKLRDVLKQVPDVVNQVGMVGVSFEGAESMEVFEHPGSWTAWKSDVLKSEATRIADLSNRGGLFEFKADRAKDAAREMLAADFREWVVLERSRSRTMRIESRRFAGEAVILDGEAVFCSLLSKTRGE